MGEDSPLESMAAMKELSRDLTAAMERGYGKISMEDFLRLVDQRHAALERMKGYREETRKQMGVA